MQAGEKGPGPSEAPAAGGSVLGFLQPALVHALEPLAAVLRGSSTLGSARPPLSSAYQCLILEPQHAVFGPVWQKVCREADPKAEACIACIRLVMSLAAGRRGIASPQL